MELSQELIKALPDSPGVYLFKDQRGEVLYVGKAKNLKKRLSSYLIPSTPKVRALLERSESLETIVTKNEKEALILEANLIKKHRPKYNVVLRDDKAYPLIRISTSDRFPRVSVVRRKRKGDRALYFGPYPSARAVRETLKLLTKFFPLRRCSNAELKRRVRPCLYYEIGKCLAPCTGRVSEKAYGRVVEGAIRFLEGDADALVRKLWKEMEEASERLEFERAAVIRDRIRAIEKVLEAQAAVLPYEVDADVFAVAEEKGRASGTVLFVRRGKLLGRKGFYLKGDSEEGLWESVLKQFYDEGKLVPELVVLPELPEEKGLLEEWLSEMRGGKVSIVEAKGEFSGLYETALKNAREGLKQLLRGEKLWDELAEELAAVLRLPVVPRWVEAVDLSSLYGSSPVGAVVAFFEGEPEKSRYRKYHIRSVADIPDDYAMLYEVLSRRFKRGLEEENLPDLVVVDGGKGHLETARRVLEEYGLVGRVGLCSIAKDRSSETDKIYIPGRKNPLRLNRHSEVYRFLVRVRDEVHRFVLSFHRDSREKEALSSFLDSIPQIGPKRKKELLKNFSTPEEVLSAGEEKIASLPGFNSSVARTLIEHLSSLLSGEER